MTDLPQPPPIPPGWKDWGPLEQRAHDLEMRYWEYRRACAMVGDEPIGREEYLAHIEAEDELEAASANPFLAALVNGEELFKDDHKPEWLLEPFLARGRSHAVFAVAGAGKSFVVLAAAAALAAGRPFLNQPAGPPIHVLYCDYEMTPEDLRDRLTDFGYGPEIFTHLHYSLLPVAHALDTAEGAQELVEAAEAVEAVLVVIDTAGRAVEGEENNADTYRNLGRLTMAWLKARGITVVRVDHAGKNAEAGQRGSSAKNDDVDIVWRVNKADNGRVLEALKRRVNWVPEKVALKVTEHDDGLWTIELPPEHSAWPEGTAEAVKALEELEVPIAIGGNAAVKRLRGVRQGLRRQAILAAVRFRKSVQYGAGTTFFAEVGSQVVPKSGEIQGTAGGTTWEPPEPPSREPMWEPPPPYRGGGSHSSSRSEAGEVIQGPWTDQSGLFAIEGEGDAARPEDDQVVPGPWVDQTGLFS